MRYAVLSMLGCAAVIAYVQRSAISVPAGMIESDLQLGPQSLGWVMGAWYWGYAAFQIPGGWMADRWDSRRTLALTAVLWSAMVAAASLATGLTGLLIPWTLMGCLQAGLFPGSTKLIGLWFSDTRRAVASGILAFSMAVGISLAPLITSHLLANFSWRHILLLYALPGVLWAVLLWVAMPTAPRHAAATLQRLPATFVLRRLLTNVPMGLLCLQQFLRSAAMVFFSTWLPRFLQQTRGVTSVAEAGRLAAVPGIGLMSGVLLGGYVSDWILERTGNRRLSRQGIAVLGMLSCAALVAAAHFVRPANWCVTLMTLGAFAAAFGGISSYSVAIDFGGSRVATVFSTMNMCGNVGSGLFPVAVGWLVERYHTWELTLPLFVGLFAADALCWACLDPRGTLFEEPVA